MRAKMNIKKYLKNILSAKIFFLRKNLIKIIDIEIKLMRKRTTTNIFKRDNFNALYIYS